MHETGPVSSGSLHATLYKPEDNRSGSRTLAEAPFRARVRRCASAGCAREDRRLGYDSGYALMRRAVSNTSTRSSLPTKLL